MVSIVGLRSAIFGTVSRVGTPTVAVIHFAAFGMGHGGWAQQQGKRGRRERKEGWVGEGEEREGRGWEERGGMKEAKEVEEKEEEMSG
jgi:hypothetical protein